MTVRTTTFDAAEYLDSPEAVAEFLADAFDSGHAGVISSALSAVARARGVTELDREAGCPANRSSTHWARTAIRPSSRC